MSAMKAQEVFYYELYMNVCIHTYIRTSHMQCIIHTCDPLQRIVLCMHALDCNVVYIVH